MYDVYIVTVSNRILRVYADRNEADYVAMHFNKRARANGHDNRAVATPHEVIGGDSEQGRLVDTGR